MRPIARGYRNKSCPATNFEPSISERQIIGTLVAVDQSENATAVAIDLGTSTDIVAGELDATITVLPADRCTLAPLAGEDDVDLDVFALLEHCRHRFAARQRKHDGTGHRYRRKHERHHHIANFIETSAWAASGAVDTWPGWLMMRPATPQLIPVPSRWLNSAV